MKKKTWIIPAALLAGGVGGLLRSWYEREHFEVDEAYLFSDKIKTPHVIAFLADLHDKEFGRENERLIGAIKHVSPDLILIGGDTMIAKKGQADLKVTENLIRALVKIAPVYYGNGNHEQRMEREESRYGESYRRFREILDEYGVCYLSDKTVNVEDDLAVSGLNIDQIYYKNRTPAKMDKAYIEKHLNAADGSRYQILLAHSPLFLDAYADWGADLTLAGHFHGGTIRLPLLGGLMTPQFQFFRSCCSGLLAKEQKYMFVSRGLGTHSINLRINNRPHLVMIKLSPPLHR